jgi:hypothetical protein
VFGIPGTDVQGSNERADGCGADCGRELWTVLPEGNT